jgi:hypothetical protein
MIGGKREGAGRKAGSTTRPRISVIENFTPEEVVEFFDDLKKRAKTDSRIALYLAEQLTGKAPQAMSLDMTGNLTITFDNAFTSTPETNSKQ